MTSLHEHDLKDVMDGSSGPLVWVRRRNGSWWPGRILSVDELTECLGIKTTGTPIKLLGREEGIVDFYNLEKSKRIKAFRCGEYDECIARAKASAIHSNRNSKKNSRKYVRREDAIIHALELEKYYLTKNLVKQRKMMLRELVSTDRKHCNDEEISTNELSHSIVSFELPEQSLNSATQKRRRKNPHGSEDDTGEGITRMKYLQDLDLIGNSTGKSYIYVSMKEACAQDPYGCPTQSEADFNNNLSSMDPRSRFRHSCSSSRSTRVFNVYKNLRRRNRRRRRLTKIWLDLDKVNVPVVYQHSVTTKDLPAYKVTMGRLNDLRSSSKKTTLSLADNTSFNFSESSCGRTTPHMRQKNATVVHDFNPPSAVRDNTGDGLSHGFVNVPILFEERNLEGVIGMHNFQTSRKINSIAADKLSIHSIQVCLGPKSTEGLVGSCSTDSITLANNTVERIMKSNIDLNSNIKGHSRYSSLCRNPISESCDEAYNACDESLTTGISVQSARCESVRELSSTDEPHTLQASVNSDKAKGFACTRKFLQSGKNLQSSFSSSSGQLKGALEEVYTTTTHVRDSNKHRQSVLSVSPQCAAFDLFNSSNLASLCDVELKVQANYHGKRAPLVSLVSKLNGKAIVGHAITVEVLSDGTSTALLDCIDHLTGCSSDLLRNRVNMIYKLRENSDMDNSMLSIQEKTSNLSYTSPLLKRKPLCRRKYGLSPRKIRRLSSITSDLRDREISREVIVEKREKSSVSCIPIRVVFSRLHTALSCSSH